MTTQIDRDAAAVLATLVEAPRDQFIDPSELASQTRLAPHRLNDAVALLVDLGYVEWMRTFGTAPFDFRGVMVLSRGRYEHQRLRESTTESPGGTPPAEHAAVVPSVEVTLARPPSPVGSPFGFTDEHWETVAERKARPDRLYVVLGHQSQSEHFDSEILRLNIEIMLKKAVDAYNTSQPEAPIALECTALAAGYGEHLFNEIARDIIGSDVAIFETSDLNANVMLEMGVALTWGVRVLPIKLEGRPKPPSDISGQTWANYRDNGDKFLDTDHESKLLRMIERAIRKKGPAV